MLFIYKWIRKTLDKLNNGIGNLYYKLGYTIALHPSYFIIIPVFLSILGLSGLQNIVLEKDPEYLYSPYGGQAQQEKATIAHLYPANFSNFDPSTQIGLLAFARILVSAKDNGSMLRMDTWEEFIEVDQIIRNATITWDGDEYQYAELCAKWNGKCWENDALKISELMPEIVNGTTQINYPIMFIPRLFPSIYGNPEVDEENGVLLSAKAFGLLYFLRGGNQREKERAQLWEEKVLDLMLNTEFQHVKPDLEVSHSLESELMRNVRVVVPYFIINFILMISFSFWSLGTVDWVRSKFGMGIIGIVSALMSAAAANGLLMTVGVPFSGINMVILFLVLGIGLDDQYVLISGWHRTKITDPVPVRLAETYRSSGMSITITSLTNILSFMAGVSSKLPVVSLFCVYAGVTIAFTFVWCICFFGGFLALAGRAEAKNHHSLTTKVVQPKSLSKNKSVLYRIFCSGGINNEEPHNPKDNKESMAITFCKDVIAEALDKAYVKAVVIIIFLIYLAGGIYGITKITEGLERKDLVVDDSYLLEYIEKDHMFREYPYRLQVIINETLTYSDQKVKNDILELHKRLEESKFTAPKTYTVSYIRQFYSYLDRRPTLWDSIHNDEDFIHILKTEYFVRRKNVERDFVFNENGTKILSTRFRVQAYKITNSEEEAAWMTEMRNIAKQAPFKAFVYHFLFIFFDQFLMTWSATIQAIIYATISMTIVSFIFIPSPLCCLAVVFSIVSIEIGTMGYMALWDVNLDAISMLNVIMCIGFSVDFSAHISYAYVTSEGTTQKNKIRDAMEHLGLPIMQGAASTILGVLTLAFAPSYTYRVFFKIIFLVILFGMCHALLLLPVMFSIISPMLVSKHSVKSSCDSSEDSSCHKEITPPSQPSYYNSNLRQQDVGRYIRRGSSEGIENEAFQKEKV